MLDHVLCPRCRKVELAAFQAGPVKLDQCGQCRGAVCAALVRAEQGDWGPKSAFENRVWEFLAALLNAKIQR